MDPLAAVSAEVADCRRCPRLVAWREQVARDKRAAYAHEEYWGRGVPGFGDPAARIVVVGLAPAAHGANRTGRMFTGDRSGDFLYAALHRVGLANQPQSIGPGDGLELRNVWITSPVKCAPPANKPTAAERDACAPFLDRELAGLGDARVFVPLGQFGYQATCRFLDVDPRPKFGHGVEVPMAAGRAIVASYHVSQQNTFTGRLTEEMFDAVLARAVARVQAPDVAVEEHQPDTRGLDHAFRTFRALGMWTSHQVRPKRISQHFKPTLAENIRTGGTLTVDDIARANVTRSRLYAQMRGLFGTFDVLACPVTGLAPLPSEVEYPTEVAGQPCRDYLDWLSFAFLASTCGLPALSLPVGSTSSGLPVGLQLIGPPRGEARLLQVARHLEEALALPLAPIDPIVRHQDTQAA